MSFIRVDDYNGVEHLINPGEIVSITPTSDEACDIIVDGTISFAVPYTLDELEEKIWKASVNFRDEPRDVEQPA